MEQDFLNMIEEHQNIIYKICHIYRDTKEDQEDLFQDIVLQLLKAYPGFRNESKVSSWMYRIALNTAIAAFRKNKVPLDFKATIPEALHPIDSEPVSENQDKMFRALRTLSPTEKAVIALYLEDLSYGEIAEITGISENYVGVKINRIKTKLRKILN
jgi:RNA polymerase sigma-70 factor (ECF subfamily)